MAKRTVILKLPVLQTTVLFHAQDQFNRARVETMRKNIVKHITVTHNSVVATANENEVMSCPLGDEIALLQVKTGTYYSLDTVGAFIWNFIKPQARSFAAIRDEMLGHYDVERERCEHDLLNLLNQFAASGLIVIQDETPA